MDDLAASGDDGARDDFVLGVEVQRALVVQELQEEGRDGAAVHLAGVGRHLSREIRRTEDRHARGDDLLVGTRDLRVAAIRGGEVYDDGAGAHPLDASGGDENRSGAAGMSAVEMTTW